MTRSNGIEPFPTYPVDTLPLMQCFGSRLYEQRRLACTRGPIHLGDLSPRISTRNVVAGEAWWGQKAVKLSKASRYAAAAACIEALQSLRRRHGGQSVYAMSVAAGPGGSVCLREDCRGAPASLSAIVYVFGEQ